MTGRFPARWMYNVTYEEMLSTLVSSAAITKSGIPKGARLLRTIRNDTAAVLILGSLWINLYLTGEVRFIAAWSIPYEIKRKRR